MSMSSLSASGGIERFTGRFHDASEHRVFHRLCGDHIHGSLENDLQPDGEGHVTVGDAWSLRVVKVNDDVEVAVQGAETPGDSRAEHAEFMDGQTGTQRDDFLAFL